MKFALSEDKSNHYCITHPHLVAQNSVWRHGNLRLQLIEVNFIRDREGPDLICNSIEPKIRVLRSVETGQTQPSVVISAPFRMERYGHLLCQAADEVKARIRVRFRLDRSVNLLGIGSGL